MARLIYPNGETRDIEPDGRFFGEKQLKEIIGGNIVVIQLTFLMTLVVDKEGIPKGLPQNEYASSLLCASIYPKKDIIVGNALLCRTKQIKLDYDPESDRKKSSSKERID